MGFGTSLMWDSETDKAKANPIGTFTGAVTGSYLLSQRFSIGTGLAKGFINDDNPQRGYRFSNGNWSTGVVLSYSIPTGSQTFMGLTSSFEYNISQKEVSISLDLSYAFTW